MSLIADALKRARQEMARREAAQRGLSLPAVGARPRPHRSRLRLLVTVLAAGAVAAVAVGWFVDRRQAPGDPPLPLEVTAPGRAAMGSGQDSPSSRERSAVPVAPGPAAEEALPVTGAIRPAPATGPLAADERVASDSPREAAEAQPHPAQEPPALDPQRRRAEGSPPSSLPDEARRQRPRQETDTFLRRVDLPDGLSLELGGIAWSEAAPVALINGEAVGRGEVVDGFLVVQIEPRRVELRGERGTIFLRLK